MTLAGYFIGLDDTELDGEVINIEKNEILRKYILLNKSGGSIFNYSYLPF
jgi:hypothetical protein